MSIAYAPTQVILQTGNGQNYLIWNITSGATSFSVQRSTDGITFSTLGTSSTNSYLDSAATVGTTYWYQVASVNASGTSSYSTSYPASIVSCLPGQISLGYIRYLSKLRADKLNSLYLTTDEWNSNINQSIYFLYNVLVTNYGEDYFFADPLLLPLTGLASYPLPDGSNYSSAPACFKLNGVDLNISGQSSSANAGWIPLARSNWSDRDRFTTFPGQAGGLFYGYQMTYREMGNRLFLFPPNTNTTLRLWYVPVMTQLLQDSDMLAFSISGWSEWVINDAAKKGMIKEESLEKWQALDVANQAILSMIEATAKNRDVGQPNTVSNTRNTMGDPGFGGWGSAGFGNAGSGWGG